MSYNGAPCRHCSLADITLHSHKLPEQATMTVFREIRLKGSSVEESDKIPS